MENNFLKPFSPKTNTALVTQKIMQLLGLLIAEIEN